MLSCSPRRGCPLSPGQRTGKNNEQTSEKDSRESGHGQMGGEKGRSAREADPLAGGTAGPMRAPHRTSVRPLRAIQPAAGLQARQARSNLLLPAHRKKAPPAPASTESSGLPKPRSRAAAKATKGAQAPHLPAGRGPGRAEGPFGERVGPGDSVSTAAFAEISQGSWYPGLPAACSRGHKAAPVQAKGAGVGASAPGRQPPGPPVCRDTHKQQKIGQRQGSGCGPDVARSSKWCPENSPQRPGQS